MQLFEFLEKYTNKDEQNYPNNYLVKVINYYINKDIYDEDDEEPVCDICGRKINLEVFRKDMAFQNWLESTGLSLPYPFQPTYYYVKNSDGSNPRFYCSSCIWRYRNEFK